MVLDIIYGFLIGTFTGIVPGIHPNLTAGLLLETNLTSLTTIIFVSAITHTFLNTIPTIHLSSPDPESALALHPSQKYAQEGRAHEAVLLTLIGSLVSLIFLISLVPLIRKMIKPVFNSLESVIPFLLLITALFLIFHQRNKLIATVIFATSGILGYFVLNSEINNPLLPLFTGLFGIPSLLINTNETPAKQKLTEPSLSKKSLKTITHSLFYGSFFSFLPSVGPAQAATIQSQFSKNKSKRDFLILIGCLNTVNILFSVITLIELNKARNGAVAAIKTLGSISLPELTKLFYIALLLAFPCSLACILLSRTFIKIKNKISTKKLSRMTIGFLLIITFILTKYKGIIILILASVLGYLPYKLRTTKTTLMGCIMVPTLIYYFLRMF